MFATLLVLAAIGEGNAGVDSTVSCGAAAVYALGLAEGVQLPLSDLAARLPHRTEGCSVQELLDAAAAARLPLEAVSLDGKNARLPDRPFVVHLRRGEAGGHFVCIRPLDLKGRQYQVIDPAAPRTLVLEEAEILNSPLFTRQALVRQPRIGDVLLRGSMFAVGSACLATAIVLMWRKRRNFIVPEESASPAIHVP